MKVDIDGQLDKKLIEVEIKVEDEKSVFIDESDESDEVDFLFLLQGLVLKFNI